jgi:hypothetical protein
VPDEIRLEHDPRAAMGECTERVPVLAAKALGVEAEGAQRRADRVVDMIRRSGRRVRAEQGRELGKRLAGAERGFDPIVGGTRPREADPDHCSLPTADFTARNLPFASRGIAST